MLMIELTYKKPMSDIEDNVVAHRDYLQTFYDQNKLIVSGPKNPREGGVIFANMSCDEADQFVASDPFYKLGIADYRIVEFNPVKFDAAFGALYHLND
tara:strand:+ start:129004 stop:129297 length:294 start_codon:yes stop_codon:yes gene_type:complete